jgi:hypothetical protein
MLQSFAGWLKSLWQELLKTPETQNYQFMGESKVGQIKAFPIT